MNETVDNQVPATQQLPIDERRLVQEGDLRRADLALREREIHAKESELQRSRWLNPTVVALVGATVALCGNVFVAWYNNQAARKAAHDHFQSEQVAAHNQFQSELILRAVSTGDYDSACKNLINMINLHILDDPNGSMSKCAQVPSNIPVLPPESKTYIPPLDMNSSAQTSMNVTVTREDRGDNVLFRVAFTCPQANSIIRGFNLITVYAFKTAKGGQRIQDMTLPSIKGEWSPGEPVRFDVQLPTAYVNDVTNSPNLRFCVGTAGGCFPSPNILLSQPEGKR